MPIDLSKIKRKLNPPPDGQDVLRLRTGVITAVNANGTVDLTLSGSTIAAVPYLINTGVAVGAVVQILSYRGSLLAIGGSAGSGQVAPGWAVNTVAEFTGITSATGTTYMTVTLPSAGSYIFDVTWIYSVVTNPAGPGFCLGGTAPVSSFHWTSQVIPYSSTVGLEALRYLGVAHPAGIVQLVNNNPVATGGFGSIEIKGRITVTAGGTLTFNFGRFGGTGTLTLRTGCHARVQRTS